MSDDHDVRSYGTTLKQLGDLFNLLNIYESINGDSSAVEELFEAVASIDEDLADGMYNSYLSVGPTKSTFGKDRGHSILLAITDVVDNIFVRLSVASVPTYTDRRFIGTSCTIYSMVHNDKYLEIVNDIDNPLKI